jgi:Fur family ferric uptake transcriptional regulator
VRSGSDRLDDDALRTTLREAGLRCTDARLAVYREVARAAAPVAHRDVADALPELDRITVFRNLVALVEAGLAIRVDLGDRTFRYALPTSAGERHGHPHFTCTSCGDVRCLEDVRVVDEGTHGSLLLGAEVQIKGVCDDCR